MTVQFSSKRPRAAICTRQLQRRALVFLLLLASCLPIGSRAVAQRRPYTGPPPWADTTGESDVYPTGDGIGVYTAVLDLLYVDGKERPPYIVLWDTAQRQSGGPCPVPCTGGWAHKSRIDTATLLGFARQSPKRPRIVDFGYRIPIVRISQDEFERIRHDGYGLLADSPPEKAGPVEAFWAGFRRKYPRAWGYAMLGKAGFNPQHTEALIGVFQVCGESCRSFETIFLKRVGKEWRIIERIPEYAEAWQTGGNLRYRGPAGERQDQSQIVAIDAAGTPPRAESNEAAKVFTAILDSLYSFHGQSPRMLAITERRAFGPTKLPVYHSRIDSSTIASYNFFAHLGDALYPRFKYRLPVVWLSDTALKELERSGAPLAKAAAETGEDEQSPLWHAFHARYPGAWGYVNLGRPGFNPRHTQALVLTRHFCGTACVNTDTWFLERRGERWYVVERMPRDNQAGVGIDGLRYLGPDADPKWYRPRRAHGVVSNVLTGEVMPSLNIGVYRGDKLFRTIRSDSEGRYALEGLPMNGGILFKVRCPIDTRSDSLWGGDFGVRPGMDTTFNIALNYRYCRHLNRAHPLIARANKPVSASAAAYPSPADEAVYRGVLRALYPSSLYDGGQIILAPLTTGHHAYRIESEFPRLVRKGVMDLSTGNNFANASDATLQLRPLVPYQRSVAVMTQEDMDLFPGSHEWEGLEDAYPGARTLVAFSHVGFNDVGTQALVQVRIDSAKGPGVAETMLLKKNGAEWRVALRDVDREGTSGEWSGGQCEATDAPDRRPGRADVEKLVGDFSIVRVGASREIRGQTDTVRVRLGSLGPSPRKRVEMVASAKRLDASGTPQGKIAGTLELTGSYAAITFTDSLPEGMIQFDGWIEQYRLLGATNREFFGTWETSSGPTAPSKGYFCARPLAGSQ
jgi:hypothetical protein